MVWESLGQDGSSDGIFGRRFNVSGNPAGDEFQVNSTSPGAQVSPAVASDGSGDFVVVWEGPDGNATGIFADAIRLRVHRRAASSWSIQSSPARRNSRRFLRASRETS